MFFEYKIALYIGVILGVFFIFISLYSYIRYKKLISYLYLKNISYGSLYVGETSYFFKVLKILFFSISFVFLVLAIARPKFGEKDVIVRKIGYDCIIALDISRSMLAQDIYPSRLEMGVNLAKELVNNLKDIRFGFIVFSTDALVVSPITDDKDIILLYLSYIDRDITISGGTNFFNLVKRSINLFKDNYKTKLLVIISDGEDHSGHEKEIIEMLKRHKIKVISIAVGTSQPTPIIMKNTDGSVYYLKDNKGNIVYTRLNDKFLKELANSTDGLFINVKNNMFNVNKIYDYIYSLEKNKYNSRESFSQKEDQYQIFLLISVIFFILYLSIYFYPKYKKIE